MSLRALRKIAEQSGACGLTVPLSAEQVLDLLDRVEEAERALQRVRELHLQHKDTHAPDPSILSPGWYCCAAVQLGVTSPYECITCESDEWPCPTIRALEAQGE